MGHGHDTQQHTAERWEIRQSFNPADVEYTLTMEPEDMPVRGNVVATEDEDYDRAEEDKILARLDDGDHYAWCMAVVRAEWGGFEGIATLGGITLAEGEDEEDFKRTDADYYESTKHEALGDLLAVMESNGWNVAL